MRIYQCNTCRPYKTFRFPFSLNCSTFHLFYSFLPSMSCYNLTFYSCANNLRALTICVIINVEWLGISQEQPRNSIDEPIHDFYLVCPSQLMIASVRTRRHKSFRSIKVKNILNVLGSFTIVLCQTDNSVVNFIRDKSDTNSSRQIKTKIIFRCLLFVQQVAIQIVILG